MACSFFDRACLEAAVSASVNRLSGGNGNFDTLRTNIAAGRHTAVHEALDRGDVDFIVANAPEVPGFIQGQVAGGFMDHFDIAPKNGVISAREWAQGRNTPR